MENIDITLDKNPNTTTTATLGVSQNNTPKSDNFTKLVEKYMLCEKRTLAEMLAMRDMNTPTSEEMSKLLCDGLKESMKKFIDNTDMFKIHPDDIWKDGYNFCYLTPNGKCIYTVKGNCETCPYFNNKTIVTCEVTNSPFSTNLKPEANLKVKE